MDNDCPLIHVVAGVLADGNDRVLITQRPPGKHLAGSWEFPGGKRAPGESRLAALARELREELDLTVDHARPLIRYRYNYPDLSVDLDVWRVRSWRGEPRGLEGQDLAWVQPADLAEQDLLPADGPIRTALVLPDRYVVTGTFEGNEDFDARLQRSLAGDRRLVQLRLPGADVRQLQTLTRRAVAICHDRGGRLLLNGSPETAVPIVRDCNADGVHLPSRCLERLSARPVPEDLLFGASCHGRRDLETAVALDADFAVLGPVRPTSSHPGAATLGWDGFQDLVADIPLPVFAIGGMTEQALAEAWDAGAQGIAAITAFWV